MLWFRLCFVMSFLFVHVVGGVARLVFVFVAASLIACVFVCCVGHSQSRGEMARISIVLVCFNLRLYSYY